MKPRECFSDSYQEARRKFLKATKGMEIYSEKIIDNLYTDMAVKQAKKKDTIVVFLSGVHGVEGYTGSTFQLRFINKFLPKIKNKFSVAFIHALNPYGFKNNRRYNENNVDLNRNCMIDHKSINSKYPKIDKIIRQAEDLVTSRKPRTNPLYEYFKFYYGALHLFFKWGLKDMTKAASFGQAFNKKAIAYRGTKKERSILVFEKFIKKITKGYEKALLIDIHTGTGLKYRVNYFTRAVKGSAELKFLKKINRRVKHTESTKNRGVDFPGSIAEHFHNISNANKNYDLLIEFGIFGFKSTVLSLIYLSRMIAAENQVTHFGPKSELLRIRKKFRKLYSPNSKDYRTFLISATNKISKKIIKVLLK